MTTLRTTATSNSLEGPLLSAIGTARANVSGRTMAVDSSLLNAYVLTASGLSIIPLTPVPAQSAPAVTGNAVGEYRQFYAGSGAGRAGFHFRAQPGGQHQRIDHALAVDLGGSCVTLNNTPLPLLATSTGQINAQLPPTLAAGRYPLVVRSIANQAASAALNVTVAKYAPAIFIDAQGPAIFHKDGNRVNKQHPASRDEPLTMYATGLGVTIGGRVTSGNPSPSNPLAVTPPSSCTSETPICRRRGSSWTGAGCCPARSAYTRSTAGSQGTHIKGDALPVTLRIGGVDSPTTGPTAAVVYVN